MPRLARYAATLALCALCTTCGPPAPAPPQHVLLIVVDTLRADHLTPYGYGRETSPRLAELAAEGVVFERAIAQASHTQPSMVSLHTGSYVAQEAIKIPPSKVTLAEVFQKAGYATAAFIYNDLLNTENDFDRGFDRFDYKDPPYGPNAPIVDWIAANRDGRSFTYVHLAEPHDPYKAPDMTEFSDRPEALDADQRAYFERVSEERDLVDHEASVAKIEHEIGGYDDDVAYSDRRIGQILDAVRENGLWEKTAIVIASDHGEGLWTRLLFRRLPKHAGEPHTLVNTLQMTHGSHAHWELIHVPLIVRAPGLAPGARVPAVVENIDVASTLLELCDLPSPGTLQGKSLVALAQGDRRAAEAREGLAFTFTRFNTSVVTQDGMQLIEPTDLGRCSFGIETQLYDLERDARARENIAASHAELVERLQALVRERIEQGISETDLDFGPETQAALHQLGYLETGVVDMVRGDLASKSAEELFAIVADSLRQSCLYRWEAARALAARELGPEHRRQAEVLFADEDAPAVRDALRALFD